MNRCIDCAHSKPNAETEDETIILECHRYPPVFAGRNVNAGVEVMWMQVEPDDWCGEHRPIAKDTTA